MDGYGFEIDYMPVGNGEKSGDAIALRFGNLHGLRNEQTVVVVDGGTKESGQKLVRHIDDYYKTDQVDLVVNTHPDSDHVSGLTEVLTYMRVGQLAMHRPWAHLDSITKAFPGLTSARAEGILLKSLGQAAELENLAITMGVPVVEPFAGANGFDGQLLVLGPTQDYYESLLPRFRDMPGILAAESPIATASWGSADLVKKSVAETMDILSETLQDPPENAAGAENDSSTIMLLTVDGHKILLTGDAGAHALGHAADYAEGAGIRLNDLRLFDVPHHGSRHNLGPTILSRIGGPRAFISASKAARSILQVKLPTRC